MGTFFGGRIRVYQYFEIIMLVLVVVMTVVMVYLAFVGIPFGAEEFRYSFGDLVAGMAFQLPEGTLLSALAVLGGVGAGIELLFYSPWLAAKGYARQAHGTSSVHDRDERLATWLSVTKIDTWLGVVATLLISVAYFITGGSILAALGVVPDGVNVVETVSNVVTETLGQPFFYGFLVAALAGLYSTALGIADGTARLLNSVSDQMSSTPRSTADRRVLYRWAVCLVVLSWIVFYALVQAPTLLITVGQAILSLLFPLYALALIYLDRSVPAHFRMSLPVKAALLSCFLLFTGVWVYVAVVG